jgi:hypothetical protein
MFMTATTAKKVPRLSDTRAARAAYGKSVRQQAPLEAHAELVGTDESADPVELLEQQSANRVPELIPIGTDAC